MGESRYVGPEIIGRNGRNGDEGNLVAIQQPHRSITRNDNPSPVEFWKKQLQDIPSLLELPRDRPRPATQSERTGRERLALEPQLIRGLDAVALKLGLEKPDLLLASLHALLFRYTRQEDIVVGVSVDSGLVPVRAFVGGDKAFAELAGAVNRARTEAAAHSGISFPELVTVLRIPVDHSYHPITQVAFSYGRAEPAFPGLDLGWVVTAEGSSLQVELQSAEDLFDSATAQRMLGHWQTLISSIVTNSDAVIDDLSILTNDECQLLLKEWTATEKDFPRDQTLPGLFAEQVSRTPDAEALISGNTRLTYGELHARSLAVAAQLKRMGVGSEDLVGICAERSWEMLAGILGTLLTGAAYVPMDPLYPQERLRFMLEDSGIKVLFTQKRLQDKLPQSSAAVLFADDIAWNATRNTQHATRPDTLAYVIYTSGSTGKPKGVAIEHRSAVAFVHWAKDVFTVHELSGVLASTSICFDLSIFEMFVPLCLGGKIILAENAIALPNLPAANEVRMVNTVPSAARELVRAKSIPASVQVINLAGEPLPTSLVDALYEQTSIKKVYDLYGPTETTTYSTYTLRQPGARPTIGRPLANEQIYLLDPKQRPVPIGVPGELFIGGEGLARGYLNRPELTEQKFVPHPFKTNARVYRTGDLARWRSDGNLEFLGRMDNQVKVRGFRIELGEIEAALRKEAGVKDVAVLAREDQPGQKRLVGYVAVDWKKVLAKAGGSQRDRLYQETLRAALRKTLPEYMAPPVFVLLNELPMTPNGKVDRKALPPPEQEPSYEEQDIIEPKTPTEQEVSSAWAEVLQIRKISVNENFFEIGGDSLQAVQVIARLQERLKVTLPLSSLFETPTIESLARTIDSGRWAMDQEPPLTPIPRDSALPVSFVQERLWFFDQLLPGNPAYNMPVAWRLNGTLDASALKSAFEQVARRHEVLRTSFAYQEGSLNQIISADVMIPFEVKDLSANPAPQRDAQANAILETETRRSFNLSQPPLFRATLLRLSDNEHILLVVAHHTVSDGWSLGILLRELRAFYDAALTGKQKDVLPELHVQYADFAVWRRAVMDGVRLQAELDYWKDKMAGAPDYIELPADRPESDQPALEAGRCTIEIDSVASRELAERAQREGNTTFHLLISALAVTLGKWAGREEMVIGTVVAGRNRPELESVIGCFMNFLPLRLNLSDADTGEKVVRQVKTAVLEAQAHQDCPFEKMVEALNPERRLNRNPLYNVALLFQNYRAAAWNDPSLQAVPIPTPPAGALLDLRFEVEPLESGLLINCEYRKDLFDESTIDRLLQSLRQALQFLAREPKSQVRELALLIESAAKPVSHSKPVLAIASTFTAEPVAEPLRHWLRELDMAAAIEFAPFNQVFQELLDSNSLTRTNRNGLNILLLRLQDWQKQSGESGAGSGNMLERSVREFIAALKRAAASAKVPWLVAICPNSPADESRNASAYREAERVLRQELEETGGVYLVFSQELERWYPVNEYYDPAGDELGHVPYTPVFFTALATALARKYHALKRPPCKVIALDCDHTLWSGVCGEDGAKGVGLTPVFLELQKFMREQHDAGILLCLCSKNNESDVIDVFDQREDMPLRREHLAAWRLNWRPKSENLKTLAHELRLGLDSFVFIDDNPLECADVEANCPEVLTLQLPEDPARIPEFLRHCWVFDHLKLTTEDRKRSDMYRQNRERERLREQSLSMADFLASLELEILIEPMRPQRLVRAAQLTERTNQFNFTTRRRTEAELQALAGQAEIATVFVKDRFGNYGLTGLLIFAARGGSLDVDTFLLSCRVLGRGVEHRMLAWLGNVAQQRNLNWVDVHFHTSARNRPGLDFLESVGAPFRQGQNGGYLFRFPAGFAAEVVFNPQNGESIPKQVSDGESNPRTGNGAPTEEVRLPKFHRCREIALEFADPVKIHEAIEAKTEVRTRGRAGYVPPQNETEKKLSDIWQKLLRVERVGTRDNFFELGGHSLLAVRMFAEIEKEFGRKLPLVTLFQNPTIRKLSRALNDSQAALTRSLLVPLQPHGSKPPLFLVHGAGGDVLWGYANLAAHLPPDQPIYGIKSRGQAGEEEFGDIEEMASHYVREIKRFQPAGPYFLGGYCFGGNVAYEMGRQLNAQGEKVGLVVLLDAAPANAGYERVTWWRPTYAPRFARNLYHWLHDFSKNSFHEQASYVSRKLRALWRKSWRAVGANNGRPTVDIEDVIDPSLFPANELKLWRIHLDAMKGHVQQPLDGKVVLLRTRGQPLLCSLEEDFCWRKLAKGGVDIRFIPGSHENVFMEPNVKTLAHELQEVLAQALTSSLSPCVS
jgi:amino acid adenylation domain-containing protein/FkbH-like protein